MTCLHYLGLEPNRNKFFSKLQMRKWVWDSQIQTTVYITDKQQRPTVQRKELDSIAYNNLSRERVWKRMGICKCVKLKHFATHQKPAHECELTLCVPSRSVASDSLRPRTAARQAPLSMGFSRRERWSGSPRPPPGDLPDPGMGPASPAPPV